MRSKSLPASERWSAADAMRQSLAVVVPDAAFSDFYLSWDDVRRLSSEGLEFGGHTRIPKERSQVDWLKQVKNIGCIGCHQLGQASTRTIPRTK